MRRELEPKMERTTIILNKTLLDRLQIHVRHSGETVTSFIKRAIVNLLENEGDLDIRSMMEVERNGEEED